MKITLRRVGLPTASSKYTLPVIITGDLKSPLRTNWAVSIKQEDGGMVKTDVIRRCGPGWLITDHALYSASIHSPVPVAPTEFSGTMENRFRNESEICEHIEALLEDAEEIRDQPMSRETGYAEFMSRKLGFSVRAHADIATEGDYAMDDARIAINAALSAQAADLFHSISDVDYRSRVVVVGTDHRVRGVEEPEQRLDAVAVFSRGTVVHCLLNELPIISEDYCAHMVALYSCAHSPMQRKASCPYRFPFWPRRNRKANANTSETEAAA